MQDHELVLLTYHSPEEQLVVLDKQVLLVIKETMVMLDSQVLLDKVELVIPEMIR